MTTDQRSPLVDLHGRSPWSIIPPLCLGFFMIMVDTTIVNIAIPTLSTELDADLVAVGWVNSAYLLTFAVLLLVTGRLGDRFGPRPMFIAGLVVFTLTSLACGLAPNIGVLIGARALQGIGAALMTPQTMSMITRVFPAAKRGAAMGVWGATAGVATIAGPVLGGALVESWGWEWIFFVNIPIGIVALWLSFTKLPTLPTAARSFDVVGMLLSIVGMFLLVFGLQEGEKYDWGTVTGPITIWMIVGAGVAVLVGFVLWQRHLGEDALMPLRLFHVRNFSLANVAGWAVTFAMTGLFFPFTIFLQSVLGLSALHAALVGLPGSLLSGIVAPFAGRLSDRFPAKWIVATGFAILVVVVAWLSFAIGPDAPVWTLVLPMTFFGIGTGFLFSPLASTATAGLDHRTAGAGAGAFNTNRQIGGVIGSAAVVALLTSRLSVAIPDAVKDAAAQIPAGERQKLLDGLAQADVGSLSTGGGSITNPVLLDAVHSGFATAVSQTLWLTVATLALGLAASLAMRATRPQPHGAPPKGEVAAAAVAH
ncbi:DHA2 family efflux MFS transporter permease subunit [Cellulomonas edaphi]|uniref:DHA2 family efflux MFS transporter permease subunit n=1 Tax=Cellulomonas edaphi TaxID=3053468 RepID=A0ABT7S553_9CELL|nr:DHA2 family efflux MFS transporter permease subunit [Cellulomons edaphi]MDM7830753.1 DHA2 family efflux MFS transporter permease subunit [Cellulomons edaphi]